MRLDQYLDRSGLWRVDAEGPALKALRVVLILGLLFPLSALAHVGSKDVFQQVTAGPYKLFVTVRMPNVIPGVANVEVRSTGAPVSSLSITPLPITGEASKHPPTPDAMKVSAVDPAFFTGGVWMMSTGSWQIRLDITGTSGEATTAVPVPAVAIATLQMQRNLGLPLAFLGLFLVISMAGVIGAAVRESRLPAGETPTPRLRSRGRVATIAGFAVMALAVWGGAKWWNVEAASYAESIYQPPAVHATLDGNLLDLKVNAFKPSGRFDDRSSAGLILDHGKMIHLYAIRMPEMDAAYHLHPDYDGDSDFHMALPAMPPGEYFLYGDVVHANGFPETLTAKLEVPADMQGAPAGADDAYAHPAPVSQGLLGDSYKLPDGYSMVWDKPAALTANTAYSFRFHLLAPDGSAATDMQPYLGMAGHAAFVKTDGSVFAHTHPDGSAAMPALMLANGMEGGMEMSSGPITNTVEFPYGFPKPGAYRIFIQMKHGAVVETGVFDAMVR
jgi:hypothetical protein